MAMLAFLLLLVSCSSMYSPLPDIEQGAGPDEITIAIQYLPSQRPLPLALQHAEFFLPRAGTLARAIQQLEHTGCGSGRLSALFAVVRDGILERPLTTRPAGLGPPEARHVDVDAYIGPRPQHPPGAATSLGTAFGTELAGIMTVPHTQGTAASSSSAAISPLTEDDSDALPPPHPHILLESEITSLRALISQIHMRLQTARGITENDEGVQMVAWFATLRNVAFAMGTLQRPSLPLPVGPLGPQDISGPHQVPPTPTSVSMAPSLADTTDLAAAVDLDQDLEQDLRDLDQVEQASEDLDQVEDSGTSADNEED